MFMVVEGPEGSTSQYLTRWRTRFHKLNWRQGTFYFVVPLFFALYSMLENTQLFEVVGYASTIQFYCSHAFLPWWLTCGITWVVKELLSAWRPNQFLVLLLGLMISMLFMQPAGYWLEAYFLHNIIVDLADSGMSHNIFAFGMHRFWPGFLQALLIWVGVNLLFDKLLGLPRYRYYNPPVRSNSGELPIDPMAANVDIATDELIQDTASDEASEPIIVTPRFLDRIPEPVEPDSVYAIKAEQHYIRVYTPERDYLVLYRFSDAIIEVDSSVGIQVHRSYWVRKDAIVAVKGDSKNMMLQLRSDLVVPVSKPYQGLVKQVSQAV